MVGEEQAVQRRTFAFATSTTSARGQAVSSESALSLEMRDGASSLLNQVRMESTTPVIP